MNRIGERWCVSTFGESHGKAIGCVIDGLPAGIAIDETLLFMDLERRRPGKNLLSTQRKETDSVEILSGVFEGKSTGAPLCMLIANSDQKSSDYESVKNIFRPGHADYTYFHKYGIRDHRGGGRSSARETVARVAAGAIAKMMLKELGITLESGVFSIGDVVAEQIDFEAARQSEAYALDPSKDALFCAKVQEVREKHDSIGGSVLVRAKGVPIGLGEPLYYKLDGVLAEAFMGLNAVKAVEIGEGVHASTLQGSQNNDGIRSHGFTSNHAGGILGGISNGAEIVAKIHFKPTPSIFISQETIDIHGDEQPCELKGRHDPCVAIRGSVVCESLLALVLADMVLLNMGRRMDKIKDYYKEG